MCNRARFRGEPETLIERFGASWAADVARPNRDPQELFPNRKAFVDREEHDKAVVDLMNWDVLGGAARWHMTNVRNLSLPQWRALAAEPANRCLVPLTPSVNTRRRSTIWATARSGFGARCGSTSPITRSLRSPASGR